MSVSCVNVTPVSRWCSTSPSAPPAAARRARAARSAPRSRRPVRAVDAAPVQRVEDARARARRDALVEQVLAGAQGVAALLREAVEVRRVLRREVLETELGVLHRQKAGAAREPVHACIGAWSSRSATTSAALWPEPSTVTRRVPSARVAHVPVAGGVHDVVAEQRPRAGRHRRDAADAEHDRAGAMLFAVRPGAPPSRRTCAGATTSTRVPKRQLATARRPSGSRPRTRAAGRAGARGSRTGTAARGRAGSSGRSAGSSGRRASRGRRGTAPGPPPRRA